MKIYVGKNKKNAKEISLKNLIESCIKSDTISVTHNGSFEDNSASWLDVRKMSNKKAIDVTILFDTKNGNTIESMDFYESDVIVDEENMRKIF